MRSSPGAQTHGPQVAVYPPGEVLRWIETDWNEGLASGCAKSPSAAAPSRIARAKTAGTRRGSADGRRRRPKISASDHRTRSTIHALPCTVAQTLLFGVSTLMSRLFPRPLIPAQRIGVDAATPKLLSGLKISRRPKSVQRAVTRQRRVSAPPLQQHGVDPPVSVAASGRGRSLNFHYLLFTQKRHQLLFRSIEESVQQFANCRPPHRVARCLRRVDERTARLASRDLALLHQAVEHRHDRGIRQRACLPHNLPHLAHISFLERPERVEAQQFERREYVSWCFRHQFSCLGAEGRRACFSLSANAESGFGANSG